MVPPISTGWPIAPQWLGERRMARAKSARRSFAMDKELHLSSVNHVLFDLTGIVRHIVEQRQLGLRKDFRECLAHEMRDDLPIGERAVDACAHGAEIVLADR